MGCFGEWEEHIALRRKIQYHPDSLGYVIPLRLVQPQREGDGRQASVVPPLYPAPAASLIATFLFARQFPEDFVIG